MMKTSKTKVTGNQKKTSEAGKVVKREKVTAGKLKPSEEEIRNKANEIYQQRIERHESGTSTDDWLKAEELLKGIKKK
jgi:hypothetical protein